MIKSDVPEVKILLAKLWTTFKNTLRVAKIELTLTHDMLARLQKLLHNTRGRQH